MIEIQLIVTGDMERNALADSLQRYFPGAHFRKPQKDECATSARLHPISSNDSPVRIPTVMRRLATRLLNAVTKSSDGGKPADYAFVIDDLELVNRDQPEIVVRWFRHAMQEVMRSQRSTESHRKRLADEVRERCSFHLLMPMAESYFFADEQALHCVGVSSSVKERLERLGSSDVEDFLTEDPDFLASQVAREDDARQARRLPPCEWQRHPKRYLEYLCQRSYCLYEEIPRGAEALRQLRWEAGATDPSHARFARSLFEDIADALDVSNPLGKGDCHPATYPRRTARRETLTLRNC